MFNRAVALNRSGFNLKDAPWRVFRSITDSTSHVPRVLLSLTSNNNQHLRKAQKTLQESSLACECMTALMFFVLRLKVTPQPERCLVMWVTAACCNPSPLFVCVSVRLSAPPPSHWTLQLNLITTTEAQQGKPKETKTRSISFNRDCKLM